MITTTACRERDDASLKGDQVARVRSAKLSSSFVPSNREVNVRAYPRIPLEKARSLDTLKMNVPSRSVENRPKSEGKREREEEDRGRGETKRRGRRVL